MADGSNAYGDGATCLDDAHRALERLTWMKRQQQQQQQTEASVTTGDSSGAPPPPPSQGRPQDQDVWPSTSHDDAEGG